MKKLSFLGFFIITYLLSFSQDLPQNPEPGKCYVRCTTPDVYVNEEVKIQVKPSYKIIKTIPAKFEKRTEKVLIKEQEKKLKVIPAKWGKENVDYIKKDGFNELSVEPATFVEQIKTIEVKPKYAQWEMGTSHPDCESNNPDDCKFWCYKGYPAEYKNVNTKTLGKNSNLSRSTIKEQKSTYVRKVIVEPARVLEEIIPAEYATVIKTVCVEDAKTIEETIPAEYITITREVLKEKGGLTSWKEVDCSLVDYQVLPINWDLNSAVLTDEAKNIINAKRSIAINKDLQKGEKITKNDIIFLRPAIGLIQKSRIVGKKININLKKNSIIKKKFLHKYDSKN